MNKEVLLKLLMDGKSTRDIATISGLHHNTVSYWIKKYDIAENSKFKKTDNYAFDKIDTKEKAYTLGFILADGAISDVNTEISVAIQDKSIVEFIARIIGGNVIYDYTFNKATRRFPRARLSKKITDITKFLGGQKKQDRHFPIVKKDMEKYLILGLFDADGCITWGYRKDKDRLWQKINITSSLKILTGVQQYLLKKLNISTIIRPKKDCDCYLIEFSNKEDVLKFIRHIYSDSDFIILKRKYLKAEALRLELEDNGEGILKNDNTVPSLLSRKV